MVTSRYLRFGAGSGGGDEMGTLVFVLLTAYVFGYFWLEKRGKKINWYVDLVMALVIGGYAVRFVLEVVQWGL